MTQHFEPLLHTMIARELQRPLDDDLVEQLHEMLVDNGFDQDDEVPGWIDVLFRSLFHGVPLPPTERQGRPTGADVTQFFDDLSDIDALDVYNHGEWIRIRLPVHGMLGFYSVEHSNFMTAFLDDVPDDGVSDLSVAKLHERSQ